MWFKNGQPCASNHFHVRFVAYEMVLTSKLQKDQEIDLVSKLKTVKSFVVQTLVTLSVLSSLKRIKVQISFSNYCTERQNYIQY